MSGDEVLAQMPKGAGQLPVNCRRRRWPEPDWRGVEQGRP
ncbi:hypothetical protein GLE_0045 [Lysobacter enzymogenes]|uniref:Uncharacterized protein n=1 Tax=Lysobacter enzymogenes TaxID=69 RepID=A0A0S2DA26_LYSEN|nr:hypothetical protein GLE_0045 [Lysobacter enzymogenes]